MKQMPIIVTHYTLNTGYQDEVQKLTRSLMQLGLEFDIEPIKSLGNWRANSNYSVWLIEKMLEKYPDRSILKTDADAVFRQKPDIFTRNDFDADFACCWFQWPSRKRELLGGTLYFANTENARLLVQRWKEKCIAQPRSRNPDLLDDAVKEMKDVIKVMELPPQYCKIFDLMRQVQNPIIEHFQASRRFRKEIDRKGLK